MNNLVIRKAKMEDLHPITELILSCSEKFILPEFSLEGRNNYLESHSLEKMSERIQTFSYQIALDVEGSIIGVVGVQNCSHLFHLHVHPRYQRQGLGQMLWNTAKDLAMQTKPQRLTVNSSRFAVPFYQKQGFVGTVQENKNGVIFYPMVMEVGRS